MPKNTKSKTKPSNRSPKAPRPGPKARVSPPYKGQMSDVLEGGYLRNNTNRAGNRTSPSVRSRGRRGK